MGWWLFISTIVFVSRIIAYLTTEYAMTNKRIILKQGFIRKDTDELNCEKVENIRISQSIIGRILKYGDLQFTGIRRVMCFI